LFIVTRVAKKGVGGKHQSAKQASTHYNAIYQHILLSTNLYQNMLKMRLFLFKKL